MEYFLLIFLHVLGGILWAGGAFVMGVFFVPAVMEAGPGAGPVMAGLIRRRFPTVMMTFGLIVVLTGLRLYMLRFSSAWLVSAEGIVLTLGALLAIAGLAMGIAIQRPAAQRLGVLAAGLAKSGQAPTPEQMAEMQALRSKAVRTGRLIAWHLMAAAALMAFHRFAVVL
jgi:hypothetical protein